MNTAQAAPENVLINADYSMETLTYVNKKVNIMTHEEAYDYICKLAVEHALILTACGGVTTIVHPDTQRKEGLYEHIQWVHGLGKHPDTLKMETKL